MPATTQAPPAIGGGTKKVLYTLATLRQIVQQSNRTQPLPQRR